MARNQVSRLFQSPRSEQDESPKADEEQQLADATVEALTPEALIDLDETFNMVNPKATHAADDGAVRLTEEAAGILASSIIMRNLEERLVASNSAWTVAQAGTARSESADSEAASSLPSTPATLLEFEGSPRSSMGENGTNNPREAANQVNQLPIRRTRVGPPTPFEDGTFSTVMKCEWCNRLSKFYFDERNGGKEHKFHDWISKRVLNRRQMICDVCNERKVPPHAKFLAQNCSERRKALWFIDDVTWDIIATFTYQNCSLARVCANLAKSEIHYHPNIASYQEHPITYMLDTRTWVGIMCPYCNDATAYDPLCKHTSALRERQYQHHMLIGYIEDGKVHLPGIARILGMTREEVEDQVEEYEKHYPNRRSILNQRPWRDDSDSDDQLEPPESSRIRDRPGPNYAQRREAGEELRLPRCPNCDRCVTPNNLPASCARCGIERCV